MTNINTIGLDVEKSAGLITSLNKLLSSYQIQYMNARGFHWNIKGADFFELHAKFEEVYNDLLLKVDEIAERILTIEGVPLHAFSDYIEVSDIEEEKGVSDGKLALNNLLIGFTKIIIAQRAILEQAGDAGDEGTVALMSDYISQQEKLVWMLRSYLN
ncbi:MAG: Dps family protein [Pseudomonadota bacterium]